MPDAPAAPSTPSGSGGKSPSDRDAPSLLTGPSGKRIRDGFPTLINLPAVPGIAFWEKEVTPVGVDGGGPNDTTNMRNTAWRTRQPKKLRTADNVTVKAQYDPKVITDIVAQCNVNQQIEVVYPDTSKLTVWGWLNSFKPDALKEGEAPEATVEFVVSNQDSTGAEIAPSFTPPTT